MKRLFAVTLLVAGATMINAAPRDVGSLLKSMRKAYSSAKTAAFKSETTLYGIDGDLTVNMSGVFKAPGKLSLTILVKPDGE